MKRYKGNMQKWFKMILACMLLVIVANVVTDVPSVVENKTITVEKKNKNKKKNNQNNNTQKQTEKQSEKKVETEAETETEQPMVEYKFRNERYLTQHFEKHGAEFDDYETAEEYEKGASAVVNNPEALHKTEKEDGDDVYYLEETNEFVIVSQDGYLRTYFKPSAGIKYYNRQ